MWQAPHMVCPESLHLRDGKHSTLQLRCGTTGDQVNRWAYWSSILIGFAVLLGPTIYWFTFALANGDVVRLQSKGGMIHVVRQDGAPVHEWPITIAAPSIGDCSLSTDLDQGLVLFYEKGSNKYYSVGRGRVPLPGSFLPRLKEFLEHARQGRDQELTLRPPLRPLSLTSIPGICLAFFGIWGLTRGRALR